MWRQLELLNLRCLGTDFSSRATSTKDSDGACALNWTWFFFDEFPQNGFQLYTSLRLIERRCGCQIWKNVFVLKIRGLDNFSCDLNWYQKKVQSLQNSVQKTVCKKLLLPTFRILVYIWVSSHQLFFQDLTLYFSNFHWRCFVFLVFVDLSLSLPWKINLIKSV